MSMIGELTYFLGLQIKQEEDGIYINQSKYVKNLLIRFCMNQAKEIGTPMSPATKLDKDKNGKDIDQRFYRGMIGSFSILLLAGQMFSFCLCLVWLQGSLEFRFLSLDPLRIG